MMNPLVWIYGGVHDDPGTRQRFLAELGKQKAAPQFVAVEWEKSVFEKFLQWRPWVEERVRSRWDFLTSQDCRELSLALAWEGDAYKDCFPAADPLWLETGFQEADLERRFRGKFPESIPQSLAHRLCDPCGLSMSEMMANVDPHPEPRSKKELIDRVWQKAWSEAFGDNNFERDARWASTIAKRCLGLREGCIAVVVGWTHADPSGGNQRLRGLLLSEGFSVNSVRLGP
jgi:hypothetical protein